MQGKQQQSGVAFGGGEGRWGGISGPQKLARTLWPKILGRQVRPTGGTGIFPQVRPSVGQNYRRHRRVQ